MRRRTLIIIAVVLVLVLLAGAYFGGLLLGISGPSGSVKAWSYEQGSSALTPVYFTGAGLAQDFAPTTSVADTTSVYIQVEVDGSKYGPAQYNFVWAISCNGTLDSGGTGGATWDTTQITSQWLPMPMNNPGNLTVGDSCSLYVHGVPLTSGHTINEVGWIAGGTVQDCPTCPAIRTKNTIVWGTPAGGPPASPTLKTSFTYNVSGFTAVFQTHTSGGQGPYTYHWNFGDGKMLNETKNAYESEIQTHTYPAANGTYKVTMYVSDSTGVSPTQTASLSFVKSTTQNGCTSNCGGASTTVEVIPSWVWIVVAIAVIGAVVIVIGSRRGWF